MAYLIAALVGVVITLLVGYIFSGYRAVPLRRAAEAHHHATARAWDDLTHVVAAFPSGAVLVGPHDEVLAVNADAQALGMTRGTRLGFPGLLDCVRQVRGGNDEFRGAISRAREAETGAGTLDALVLPVGGGAVLVIAEGDAASQRVEAVRRDFVAGVSHELKTPIGAIGILAETIEAAADDPAQVMRFAQRLQQEQARLAELVSQIIELSRLQSSDPMAARATVEIPDVVNEALSRTRASADSRSISLVVGEVPEAQVMGDRWQLVDAVANLVQNAINYSDPGARVVVTGNIASEDDQDMVQLRVSDNGIGISQEDQERIFERFYRVDHSRSRETGGTGLGLSIVRHTALAHGGSVTVWSRPRQGSTFTLSLPITMKDQAWRRS